VANRGQEVAARAVGASGSLTPNDVFDSIPTFTANYVNRGETVLLRDSDGFTVPFSLNQILSASDFVQIATDNKERHDFRLYAAESVPVPDPLTYVGGPENNTVKLWSLYDSFSLGAGLDVAGASGNRADYNVSRRGDGSLGVSDLVANRDGADVISGAERLSFDDVVLAFDTDGVAGVN